MGTIRRPLRRALLVVLAVGAAAGCGTGRAGVSSLEVAATDGAAAAEVVSASPDAQPPGGGGPASAGVIDNTSVTYDVLGQRLDAHDGDLLQVDGVTYLYGTAYGCGFVLNEPGPYCGVRVYSSTDLATWSPAGAVAGQYAFDHLAGDWQSLCTAPSLGCFRPHVVQRPSDGKFVMWLNTHTGVGPQQAAYRVLVADAPGGPFVDSGVIPRLAVDSGDGGLEQGDHDITVDQGEGYVTYTAIDKTDNAHRLIVERLDPTLTTGTGEAVEVSAAGRLVEAPSLFRAPQAAGAWFLAYSDPAVPYGVARTSVVEALGPLGPWGDPRVLQADSCSGQPAAVVDLGDVTVYMTDRWVQMPTGPNTGVVANQAQANVYLAPLAFDAAPGSGRLTPGEQSCQPAWTRSVSAAG